MQKKAYNLDMDKGWRSGEKMIQIIMFLMIIGLLVTVNLSSMAKKKKKRRSRKYHTISIIGDIAPLGWGYQTVRGRPIGSALDDVINAVMDGNIDLADLIMTELRDTLNNVTGNPVGVGVRLALGVGGFKWLSKMVGKKKIFQFGKWRLTT